MWTRRPRLAFMPSISRAFSIPRSFGALLRRSRRRRHAHSGVASGRAGAGRISRGHDPRLDSRLAARTRLVAPPHPLRPGVRHGPPDRRALLGHLLGGAWRPSAVAYGGSLTTTGAIPYPLASVAVVSGAVLGSACNLTISRRYGRPFIERFGRYIGVTDERLIRAEHLFRRLGPWAIIVGRHIPGTRIVLSALCGILGVPYRVFVPCVLVSASI